MGFSVSEWMPSPWSEEDRVLGQGLEAWCRKGGSWGCFDLPCSAARPSHAPIPLWRSPSPILRERGPVWRARCLPSPQEASVKDWPQGVRGWPSQGWVAHVATERQFHHVLRTPCPGLAGSPRGFSESIACFGSEHRGRWRSGEGAAMLDCIPGALGTAPPGGMKAGVPRSSWVGPRGGRLAQA